MLRIHLVPKIINIIKKGNDIVNMMRNKPLYVVYQDIN